MGRDFRVSTSWRTHLKRKLLQTRHGPEAVLFIMDLWSYAAENHPDGVLKGMTPEEIGIAVGCEAHAERMLDACVAHRLIDMPEDPSSNDTKKRSYKLHDWEHHQAWLCAENARKTAARKAAKIKWKMRGACEADAERMRGACTPACEAHAEGNAPSPSPSPSPNINIKSIDQPSVDRSIEKKKAKKQRNDHYSQAFEEFWLLYPRRTAKGEAWRVWKKYMLDDDEQLRNKVMSAIQVQKDCSQWKDKKYIPHPATWLNQRRWDDDVMSIEQKESAYWWRG